MTDDEYNQLEENLMMQEAEDEEREEFQKYVNRGFKTKAEAKAQREAYRQRQDEWLDEHGLTREELKRRRQKIPRLLSEKQRQALSHGREMLAERAEDRRE